EANPYFGMLAAADAIVVTGETMSMLAEACDTLKPVYIFDMGRGWTAMRPDAPRPAAPLGKRLRARAIAHWAVAHLLPPRVRRDTPRILPRFAAPRRAAWLGDAAATFTPAPSTDLPRVVARVHALF